MSSLFNFIIKRFSFQNLQLTYKQLKKCKNILTNASSILFQTSRPCNFCYILFFTQIVFVNTKKFGTERILSATLPNKTEHYYYRFITSLCLIIRVSKKSSRVFHLDSIKFKLGNIWKFKGYPFTCRWSLSSFLEI